MLTVGPLGHFKQPLEGDVIVPVFQLRCSFLEAGEGVKASIEQG